MTRPATTTDAAPVKELKELYVVKMRPALATQIIGQAVARIPFSFQSAPGAPKPKFGLRLLLREFDGGPTGRADLVKIVAIDPDGLAGYVNRHYCRHKVRFDDEDLKDAESLGYTLKLIEGVILEAL